MSGGSPTTPVATHRRSTLPTPNRPVSGPVNASGENQPGTRTHPPQLAWLPVEGNNIPEFWAIQGGWGPRGSPFYIACHIINPTGAEYGAGRAGPRVTGSCRIPRLTDRSEQVFNRYEVLATNDSDTVQWIPYPPGDLDPAGVLTLGERRVRPIPLQESSPRGPLFIIRCYVNNGALLVGTATGKTATTKSQAWCANTGASDGGFHDVSSVNCEVLCYGDAWD